MKRVTKVFTRSRNSSLLTFFARKLICNRKEGTLSCNAPFTSFTDMICHYACTYADRVNMKHSGAIVTAR